MILLLFLCLVNLTVFVNGGRYKLFRTGGEQWSPSRQLCIDNGMDLAIIKSNTELQNVQQYITCDGGPPDIDMWIGLEWDTVNNVHKWLDGEVISWAIWESGEPNCMVYDASCYALETKARLNTNYKFMTREPTQLFDVLCENVTWSYVSGCPSTNQQSEKGLPIDIIIGLAAGFGGFIVLCCMCCCLWKFLCGDKDENKIDQDPDIQEVTTETAEQMKKDNPWMKHEEISFCLRQKYVFNLNEEVTGKRYKYIK